MPDEDYPTDEDLEQIRTWPFGDAAGWFAFVKAHWWMPDWGWREADGTGDSVGCLDKPARRYHISTGGWSGNESLIEAMEKNVLLWSLTWEESRRGGHYKFSHHRQEPTG